jgi:hypothetical protein
MTVATLAANRPQSDGTVMQYQVEITRVEVMELLDAVIRGTDEPLFV